MKKSISPTHTFLFMYEYEKRRECFRWYFGKLRRVEAEKLLLMSVNEHGYFLVRDSESRQNEFSLSGLIFNKF